MRFNARLCSRIDIAARRLKQSPFLKGERFSVADAYLFTILSWSKKLQLDLSRWPMIEKFMGTMRQRPAVQEALKAEGIA